MSYAFRAGESIPAGIRRIVTNRIDRAIEHLTDESSPLDERVHGARKRFKEIRAVLRLIRDPLGESFSAENLWYRDAGRELGAARDADAMLEAIDKLLDAADDKILKRALTRARRVLKTVPADLEPRVARLLDSLPFAKLRIESWPDLDDDFATIGGGLRRTYRNGRRAMQTAIAIPTMEHLHEWRKRVKDHWYHSQLLEDVWPTMMKPHLEAMEQLSHALGDDHDLAVLRERTGSHVIHEAIDARRAELQKEAESVGRRMYADSPKAVASRFEAWWKEW
ncbi:MAG TPA: CHAD domain-containing protein [Thermoanaerobaculia bacterium]|nr:CHAD domain-containing protein [Thermoanaerobaculia bacterium]